MAAKARPALDPVADLSRRLARRQTTALRACVLRWWTEHGLAEHPPAVGKRIALALLEHPHTDVKLAGIVVLHEQLADHLGALDLVTFEPLFAGALADASVVDWFAIKVIGTMLLQIGRAHV